MKNIIKKCFIAFLFSNFLVSMVHADNRDGAFVLTPSVGGYFVDAKRDIKNNALFNLGLGYDITQAWGIEALAGTMRTQTKSDGSSLWGNFYALDGVYHFNTNMPLVPYVLAGAGLLDFSISDHDTNPSANLNGGAGLEYFLGNSVALRSDVRDIYTPGAGKSDVLVNVGFSFLLGGQNQTMPQTLAANPEQPCFNKKVLIRFANGSAELEALYKAKLASVVACLQRDPKIRLNVDGYANSSGLSEKDNIRLSQKRAEEVKKYLVQAGASSQQVIAQGFGEGSSDSVIVSVIP